MKTTNIVSVSISLALHVGGLMLILYSVSNQNNIRQESRQNIIVSVISASKFDAEISTPPQVPVQTFQKVNLNRSENLDRNIFELGAEFHQVNDVVQYDNLKLSKTAQSSSTELPVTSTTISQNPGNLIEPIRILDSHRGFYKMDEKTTFIEVTDKILNSNIGNETPQLHHHASSIKKFTPFSPDMTHKQSAPTINANINVSQAELEPLSSSWGAAIEQKVLNNLIYPKKARNMLLSGKVYLKLEIFSDGRIFGVYVRQSSGHKILDRAAKAAVFRVRKLPAAPKDYPKKKFIFNLPVQFSV